MPEPEFLNAVDAEEMLQLTGPESIQISQNEESEMERNFHINSVIKIINFLQSAIDEAMGQDPIMTRSMEFKHSCNLAVTIYEDLYRDYMRRIKQTCITQYFAKK